jgi:NAD(P)H dehydrogenase (quinone)
MTDDRPILVTGAAGSVGAVGRSVVEILRRRDLPVRALVRGEDERSQVLRATGAEVVVGDLTHGADVLRAVDGCRRMYFGMSVSAAYLEAALITASAAREYGGLDAFVNMSQLTVSEMNLTSTQESVQHRWHWLAEQALGWSGLPIVQVRPTVFLENPLFLVYAVSSIMEDGTIRLPFGSARTSPIAAADVAEAVAVILQEPGPHVGKVRELTGRSCDLTEMAAEYSEVLGRPVTYVDVPLEPWIEDDLGSQGLPGHLLQHLATMARLHAAGRYDRATPDLEMLLGRPPSGVQEFVRAHAALFG